MAELDFISKFSGEEIDNILDKSQELLNKGYTFFGVATPETDPGTPSLKVFYLTTTAGKYANFDNITIESGKLTVLLYNGSMWQAQAFANLGMKVYVTDSSFSGSTLSAEEIEEVYVSKAILFADTGDLFLFGSADNNRISFYRLINEYYIGAITVSKSSGVVSGIGTYAYQDKNALHFTAQNPALTSAQQDVALSNIGLKWVNVPYSLLNTTLDDATYAKIKNANGLILTDASSEYYGPLEFICGANNSDGVKVFSGLNLADTSAYIALRPDHSLTNVKYLRTYNGAVPYDASKTLTDTQKQQARTNIGVQSADELIEDADFIAQLKTKLGIA